ncbi:hypothetical protein [Urbifossiella limnaea]|uniref:Uncharacterized protein n=1 Tax=Urbifossiella limnaea TaxID=2528023 RepID=A0A517XU85_9BACT|nr:hypothetical protein [Urbifossiella limnaea]QDU21072.1 hypothetical protein ETAA1_30360 [Urbifossiella limnaea]
MSRTETSGVVTAAEGTTVTVPSDRAPAGDHAVVLHTPVVSAAITPMTSPVASSAHAHQEMTYVPGGARVQLSSADQL